MPDRWLLLDLESVSGIIILLAFVVLVSSFLCSILDALRGKK